MKKKMDKRLDAARRMPPRKKVPNREKPYDATRDEVLQWISEQPELLQYLSDVLARNRLIEYDAITGCWKGADYHSH